MRADGLSGAVTSETTSQLDPNTVTVIRRALALAQGGRIAEACSVAERALAEGGDPAALHAMLGLFYSRSGDWKAAIRHLEVAHQAKPSDHRIAANLADALFSEGQFQRILEVVSSNLARSDTSLHLARVRGYAAQMAGDPGAAADAYQHVVDAAPDDWESWNNLGNALVASEEIERGIAALRRAADLNPEVAPTRLNLARAFRQSGDWAEAERQLRTMADHFPADIMPLMDLYELLKEWGRPGEEILEVLRRASEIEPGNRAVLLAMGTQLALLFDLTAAEDSFRRVLAQDATNADAYIGLMTVYDLHRAGDLDELVAEAEQAAIDSAPLNLIRAFAHRRAKRFEDGLAALAHVPEDLEPSRRAELLGQFLEGLGNYDEAFAAYVRMNEIHVGKASRPLVRAEALRDQRRQEIGQLTAAWFGRWQAPPIESEERPPVFLVGFPRSGTTLLDTMLMGHPDVDVMEERPALRLVDQHIGGFDKIPDLGEAQVRDAQRRYFETAAQYDHIRDEALLVDKSPLHLSQVPLIHRLFPKARFILALRHPLDSLFSCFVSNFRLNSSMSNFLRLDTAAEFYDLTFRVWEKSREIFAIDVETVVYEELVNDPERELRRLAGWLGLDWTERMLDHRKTAAQRGLITTASYAQVTEPVYRRSVGRWQNYRKHLEPVVPVMAPWVEKFGYKL